MAFVAPTKSELPTNPSFSSTGFSNNDRIYTAIASDNTPSFSVVSFSGSLTSNSNLATTKGFRIKCYASRTSTGIQFNPADFATRNYYVLVHSDDDSQHHFARITEIITEDVEGDAFEFEPKLGNEIPKDSKFLIFTGELKSVNLIALSAGILQDSSNQDLQTNMVCSRPLFYFHNNLLDKKDELNHNTKYFAMQNGGTATTYALSDSVSGVKDNKTFRTVQDFGKKIIDYSKYSLEISLTDKLRDLDNTISGSITTNEGQTITFDEQDYNSSFPNARRDLDDNIASTLTYRGPTRYIHYDYSPTKANFTYGVFSHENIDSMGQKGGFAESSIVDSSRIMSKKIKEFYEYRVRHLLHRADINEWFPLQATYSSTTSTNVFEFDTEYDLSTVLNVGDEIKIDDTICIITSFGSFGSNLQEITVSTYKRTTDLFFSTSTLTPSADAILYRRAYNPTDNTLMLDMDLIDSRFSKLYIGFTTRNMNDLFASVTACDKSKSMLTLSFDDTTYNGNALKYVTGDYSVFVERFNGEIEQIESRKQDGQTIVEIKGRDKLNKLLSPIVNLNTLFSEDIIYSTKSPYNKLGSLKSGVSFSVTVSSDASKGDRYISTSYTGSQLDYVPSVGDYIFTANTLIGKIKTIETPLGVYKLYVETENNIDYNEELFIETEKNYILNKALSSSHLTQSKPSSLTGAANKGLIFTSGKTIDSTGAEQSFLVESSSNSHPNAVGYAIHEPSNISKDLNFQSLLRDETGSSVSNFDTVNTLLDFEIVSLSKKDNITEIELAPYVPFTLGRKMEYHFDKSEYTFTQVATVSGSGSNPDVYFDTTDSSALALKNGNSLFLGENKTFIGKVINVYNLTTLSGTLVRVFLDRTNVNYSVSDIIYTASKPNIDLAFINGAHLWGGKFLTNPHPKVTTNGLVLLDVENTNSGSDTYNEKYGQMLYKVNAKGIGNFENDRPIPSDNIFGTTKFPKLYPTKSVLNHYANTYQIKPNTSNNNLTIFDKTDSSYRTLPLDIRGITSVYGSNFGDARIYNNHKQNIVRTNSLIYYKSKYGDIDNSASRLFLYVNSDLLPYSSLRPDSIMRSDKTLTDYNLCLIENKESKDIDIEQGHYNSLKDENFQNINFNSNVVLSSLKRFGLMRLTEVCFDAFFNPVNPEKPVLEKYPNNASYDFGVLDNFASLGSIDVGASSGATLVFTTNQTISVGDYIYDEDTGDLIGEVQTVIDAKNYTLTANAYLTNSGSYATNVGKYDVSGGLGLYFRNRKNSAHQDFLNSYSDNDVNLLKCAIMPDGANYEPSSSAITSNGTNVEISLPFALTLTDRTTLDGAESCNLKPLGAYSSGISGSSYGGGFGTSLGVNLKSYTIEKGNAFGLEDGATTQTLFATSTHNYYSFGGSPNMSNFALNSLADFHYKNTKKIEDTSTSYKSSDPHGVNGSFMVFKPRLWVNGHSTSNITSSNGNVVKNTISIASGYSNHFLNYIDLTGCYLVPEEGYHIDSTQIDYNSPAVSQLGTSYTRTEFASRRMNNVRPTNVIYVISHEIDSTTITDHHIITNHALDDDSGNGQAYRVLQPNEVCMYDFFPNRIYMNTLSSDYTKKATENKTYSFKEDYFHQEGSIKSGGNFTEDEGVLSMFVALDTDKQTSSNDIRTWDIKTLVGDDEKPFYFTDGENKAKITVKCEETVQDIPYLELSKPIYLKGVVSVSEPFTVTSFDELKINPTRACIGSTVNVGLEAEDIINELLETEGIEFETTTTSVPMFLAPNYQGLDLFSAINYILDRKEMKLVEENSVFKIIPENDSNYYSNIILNDTGDYQIFEFEKVSTLFDFFNEITVYGNVHKSTRKDLRSIQQRGRKTLEVVDDSLLTQQEVDKKAQGLLQIHSTFNQKLILTVSTKGLNQLRAGDIINVEIVQENIELSQYLVLQITHELNGLMKLELGRYSKDLSDLFSEILITNKQIKSSLRNQKFTENNTSFDFLDTFKIKELKLHIRKFVSTGTTLGFTTTLNTSSLALGFGGGSTSFTDLIEEELI